jgi:hypothetical protein
MRIALPQRSAQAQAGFEAVVKVSDGDAAHAGTLRNDFNDFNDCIVINLGFREMTHLYLSAGPMRCEAYC